MDFIKKTICIEEARTRTQGLMPYYAFGESYEQHSSGCGTVGSLELEIADGENGNWGQFVANPCFLAKEGKTYEAMLRKYYELLNMVREGVKLRKVETKGGEGKIIFTEDVGAFYLNGQCFSGGTEPDSLYQYAAYNAENFTSTEIESLREETRNIYKADIPVDYDFIVLIKDYDKFQDLAKYLSGTNYSQVGVQSGVIEGADEHTRWAEYCKVVDECIGIINIPASIYNTHIKVPKRMPCADVEPYIKWLTNYQTLSADCCNARLYEDMGGDEMLTELNKYVNECQDRLYNLSNLDYAVPYIEMPLLLVQNYTDVGVLTNLDGVEYSAITGPVCSEEEPSRPHGELHPQGSDENVLNETDIELLRTSGIGLTIDEIIMGTSAHTEGDLEVESLLQTLRNKKKFTDDNDNVLPGDFQKFSNPAGEMYACVKRSDEKFYILDYESYDVIEGGETITYWKVFFKEKPDGNRDEIWGLNNLNRIEIPFTPSRLSTEEQASGYVFTQLTHYKDCDKSDETNEYFYEICLSLAEWTMYDIGGEPQDSINGDGLDSKDVSEGGTRYPAEEWRNASGKIYRTITTQAAGVRIAQTEEEETRKSAPKDFHYFFYVKYDNSGETPDTITKMTYPYKNGNVTNVYLAVAEKSLYRGDFIPNGVPGYGITADTSTFKVKYVIGGYFIGNEQGNFVSWPEKYQNIGDVYYEEYDLDRNHIDYVALDGVDRVPVYSEYIDFIGASKEFYSPIYDLYRTGNTATIIRLTSGDIWSEEFNKTLAWKSYDAYLAKEEYLTNFSLPPKVDVNVTIDRGGVSVFEKHYKLSECNTMQDLVNYGNNFFNI